MPNDLVEKYSFWDDSEDEIFHEGSTECNCGGGSCNSCSSGCGDGGNSL